MRFAHWLNGLTGLDFLILLVIFSISCGLSYLTIRLLRNWYQKIQEGNPYRHEFRITPFNLMGIAGLYAFLLYRIVGIPVTHWIRSLAQ